MLLIYCIHMQNISECFTVENSHNALFYFLFTIFKTYFYLCFKGFTSKKIPKKVYEIPRQYLEIYIGHGNTLGNRCGLKLPLRSIMLNKYLLAIIKPLNRMVKSTMRKEERKGRKRKRDSEAAELKFINGGQGA